MSRLHIMLDLETMGMAPNGAIASIGAIEFDPFGDEISNQFHVAVDLDGQEKLGRVFNGSTVKFWLQQSPESQKALLGGGELTVVLRQFAHYVGETRPCWAYGATFDHSILQSAYDAVGVRNPIHYRDQVCMRGLAKMAKVDCPDMPGVAHNALDDATRQARWLQAIMRGLRKA